MTQSTQIIVVIALLVLLFLFQMGLVIVGIRKNKPQNTLQGQAMIGGVYAALAYVAWLALQQLNN